MTKEKDNQTKIKTARQITIDFIKEQWPGEISDELAKTWADVIDLEEKAIIMGERMEEDPEIAEELEERIETAREKLFKSLEASLEKDKSK